MAWLLCVRAGGLQPPAASYDLRSNSSNDLGRTSTGSSLTAGPFSGGGGLGGGGLGGAAGAAGAATAGAVGGGGGGGGAAAGAAAGLGTAGGGGVGGAGGSTGLMTGSVSGYGYAAGSGWANTVPLSSASTTMSSTLSKRVARMKRAINPDTFVKVNCIELDISLLCIGAGTKMPPFSMRVMHVSQRT